MIEAKLMQIILNELEKEGLIEVDIKNGKKSWRLKNYNSQSTF